MLIRTAKQGDGCECRFLLFVVDIFAYKRKMCQIVVNSFPICVFICLLVNMHTHGMELFFKLELYPWRFYTRFVRVSKSFSVNVSTNRCYFSSIFQHFLTCCPTKKKVPALELCAETASKPSNGKRPTIRLI